MDRCEKEYIKRSLNGGNISPIYRYKVVIETLYKGRLKDDTVFVYSGGVGYCGFPFNSGDKYVIYGGRPKLRFWPGSFDKKDITGNAIHTSVCCRTMGFDTKEVEEIEKYLNPKKLSSKLVYLMNHEIYPVYFDRGNNGLREFIRENLILPADKKLEGTVLVSFTVDTNGNVINVQLKKGVSKELNEEALRIVNLLKYIPGKIDGIPKEMEMLLPISFRHPGYNIINIDCK